MRQRLLYFDSSFVFVGEGKNARCLFFVLAIITSGRVNARFHHKKEGQMEVDWGVVICFRWAFLKECPFPSLQLNWVRTED